jgi:hypothetical protein
MTELTPEQIQQINTLENHLINEINALNDCLKNSQTQTTCSNPSDGITPTDITNMNNLMSNTTYTVNHQYILNLWNTIRRLRNELDVKLQRVNRINNSEAKEQEMKLNNTIYINVLLAVLSTSILFFLFSRKK